MKKILALALSAVLLAGVNAYAMDKEIELDSTEMMWACEILGGVSAHSGFFRDKLEGWQIRDRKEWLVDSVKKEIVGRKKVTLEDLLKDLKKEENPTFEQDWEDVKEILDIAMPSATQLDDEMEVEENIDRKRKFNFDIPLNKKRRL